MTSGTEWISGLVVGAVAVISIAGYRRRLYGVAGSVAYIMAAVAVLLLAGLLPRPYPVFGINASPLVWSITAVGSVICLLTVWCTATALRAAEVPHRSSEHWMVSRQLSVAAFGTSVALAIAAVNYATGVVPALAADVNTARFEGDFGIAGKLWPVIYPVMQVSVLMMLILMLEKRLRPIWVVLGLAALGVLVLSAGRSLYALPILAFGIYWIETRRPRMGTIAVFAGGVVATLGLLGFARAFSGSGAQQTAVYLSDRGLLSWYGLLDVSIQSGPRVSTIATASDRLHGQFLFGDILNFVNDSYPRSDRVVTQLIGRDLSSNGGMPPSIWSGFFLDFGWIGLVAFSAAIGLVLVFSQRALHAGELPAALWFSYLGAYVLVSAYSYVSVRPSWITVGLVCLLLSKVAPDGSLARTDGVEVSSYYRRGREAHREPKPRAH